MENKEMILEQAKKYNSFYFYDESKIISAANRLKEDFNGIEFLYSLKSNPAPAIVKTIVSQGFGADAASLEEVKLAKRFGLPPEKIQYSAPGKSKVDIEGALAISTIIADSTNEVFLIEEMAKERNMTAEIGIRINPNFTFLGDEGISSKFGIDENQMYEWIPKLSTLNHIKIVGIHVHLRSQELKAEVLEAYYKKMLLLAIAFQEAIGYRLTFINMGSGLGIPYAKKDIPLDTKYLGEKTFSFMKDFQEKLEGVKLILETGRYVVGESGYYITRVMDKKVSMGTTFIILHNTLNGFIRPSLAQLVLHYAKENTPDGSEPLFTSKDAFQFVPLTEEKEEEEVTLMGNLCTASDVIARDMMMPKLNVGDFIAISNAGSYGAVLSPMQFSWQSPPPQLILRCDGSVMDAYD
ncbi:MULTISPECIES: diaminopimelate decarboxylase family protein [Anaerotignum]|uniref:diaminopimelate decarboxylase family protein n=1 Tax=Anaerotignum TaxID=2039240 RepID=UPI0021086E22|nr:diaminopimelate decarboxylase [Anaerotignum sp.]MCQ4936118.1 diaminopimelate decarboxylase [Anaerotignum propionicum]